MTTDHKQCTKCKSRPCICVAYTDGPAMTTDHKAQVEAAREECHRLVFSFQESLNRDIHPASSIKGSHILALEKLFSAIDRLAALASASPAPIDPAVLYAQANSLGVAAQVSGDAAMAKRARELYAQAKQIEALASAQPVPAASDYDALVERSVGAMAIAEGEEGWEAIPLSCPMLVEVAALRRAYDALVGSPPAPAASGPVADEAMIRKALAPFVYDEGYVRCRFGLLDKENNPVLYTESFEQALEGWREWRVKEPNEEFDIGGWNASILVYHRDVERLYGPAKGTMECPICGSDTPHQHSGDDVSYHQQLVAQMQKADEAIRQNVALRIAQINEHYGKTPKLDAAVSAVVMILPQPSAASEPVGSILRQHLRPTQEPWCKEILLYSPTNTGDSPECRVMLYAIATTRWLHVKSGGVYEVLMTAKSEADSTLVTIYRGVESLITWARPTSEFMDGRFVRIDDISDAAIKGKQP